MMTAKEIIAYMESLQNEEQRQILMGFFKTGPGEYGEGDEFLGLKVPQTREVVKATGLDFPLEEVPELLMNHWHEVRLCGFLILVAKFEKLATKRLENDTNAIRKRDEILMMYLQYAEQANNWDLVDLSVHKILGHWLLLPSNLGNRDYKIKVLDELAASPCLWKQRMSIVCSWKTSQQGDPSWCLRYAEIHLHHPHDLMHKAVGWMLREMGKRVSMDLLREFLRQHAHEMPRTMLRYAIEKMSEKERKEWMSGKVKNVILPDMNIGDKAPEILGKDEQGRDIRLSDYKGRKLVLYFYPKDNTSGCTAEACSLRDHYGDLQGKGYEVVGVSKDSAASHVKFREKYELPFPLIADINHELLETMGAWGEKNMYGKKTMGTIRTTFVINEEGIIEQIFAGKQVKTKEHAEQILAL